LEQQDLQYKIGLTLLHGVGPRKASLLVAKMGSPEAVFREKLSVIQYKTGISRHVLQSMKREEALRLSEKHSEYILKKGFGTHYFLDANYPRRLRQIHDAPIMLYSMGNVDLNPSRALAIVGTRNSTPYGKELCDSFVSGLKDAKIQVVSGMAYGIDICAHNACVRDQISTIGVLGHGLDRIYPSVHKRTAQLMLENGGLLTEFLPGTKPDRENFPMRNRIVAGMTDATIVIESKETGGSLITAELAFDYNREVFAFPGNIGQVYSAGCNKLIATNKAQLITDANDVLRYMGWNAHPTMKSSAAAKLFHDLTDEEKNLVDYLSEEPAHVDMIALHLRIPVSKINLLLLNLEMKGVLRAQAGNMYSITQ
jgi:DNA processing protein